MSASSELLTNVMEFCIGSSFERDFENFAQAHSQVFLKSLDMDDKAEYPLEFHDVYLDYLRKFEAKIERFIEENGYDIGEFYRLARQVLEDDSLSNPDVAGQRFFLEALLATSEYENFVMLMKSEMLKYKNDGRSEAPEEKTADEDRAEAKNHK